MILYANYGTVLLLFIGRHIEVEKSLNKLALVQKPLLFSNKMGSVAIYLLYKKLFNTDQYVLWAALGSLSLLVILSV